MIIGFKGDEDWQYDTADCVSIRLDERFAYR